MPRFMNPVGHKGRCLTLCFEALVLFVLLLAASLSFPACCQPVQPSLTLVYARANGRIGDVSLTSSGELLFTNYPTKPGRLWRLTGGLETLIYEAAKTAYDFYGVAASRDGEVYVSCPYTGEVFRIVPGGGVSTVYVRPSKNVGPLAFAPNGSLYMADLIPSEGYQSVYRLDPAGAVTATGSVAETLVYTAPVTIGGIAFNSRGELFFSDGPRGRLWRVVNGTAMLYVDRKGWSTMYGIVFDQYDNLYFCDWSSPGNIYYLDFRLSLAYRVLDGNKLPLTGAKVMVTMPNGSATTLSTNSTGYVSLPKAWPGAYRLSVFWQNVSVGLFVFDESVSGKRDLACSVFNVKLAARDSSGKALTGCVFRISLPNGTVVEQASPASLSFIPAGLVTVQALYKRVLVAGPLDVNVSSNVDLSVGCRVHSLSLSLLDSAGNHLKNAWIRVSLNDVLLVNQSYPEGGLTLEGLLDGKCVITASLRGLAVVQSDFYLNNTRTIVLKTNVSLTSNVSRLVLTVRDLFGLPLQGVRVSLTMSNGSIAKGETDENGVFTLSQIPVGEVNAVLETFFEKRVLSLRLDRDVVEATQVFSFSWATILVSTVLLPLVLIILPPTRRRIAKIIPVEVSIGESRDISTAYLETLSSKGLMVEEAVEIKTGETMVLAGEGRILPQVVKTVDHAVFLVSDTFFIPPRREARVLMELKNPEKDVETVTRLVKHYGGVTGLRALGILVCSEPSDRLLNLLKGFRDVEVV
ncbi:MAG: hypothetical protein QXO76_10360, partial [Thermoproteota archaeon]